MVWRMEKPLLDQRWPWLLAAALLLILFASSFVDIQVGEPGDPRPMGSADDIEALAERDDLNVLFILVDTLRAERLGMYGYERDTSPNLDRRAASGVRFARHLSQSSWTKTSMVSLWSGLYPRRTGVLRFDDVIPEQARLPAEILREAGFTTSGIWRNGWVATTFGFDQGFDVYTRPGTVLPPASVRRANPTLAERGTDEDAIASAIEFLRVNRHDRWFLYLHLMDVHEYLYDEQSALFGGSYSDIYDNAIRRTDGILEVLMEYLADMGLADRTLIAITSDHGEAFLERGIEGHARAVYRETTEVPFVLLFPFRMDQPVVVNARTRGIDVWPTLLELVGAEPLPEGIDGRSLRPEILAAARGEPLPEGDRSAIAYLDRHWAKREQEASPMVAVSQGSLRYIRGQKPGGAAGKLEELFDAGRDPAELQDRLAEDPPELAALRALADAHEQSESFWDEVPKREVSEMELNQLRALGYAIP
jgi:arylsulfatase A-like enzyme